jgi:hypothetical protein
MISNTQLLARILHRVPPATVVSRKTFSSTVPSKKFDGSKPDDHVTNEKDKHNVQYDAAREGRAERASGEGSAAASEKDEDKRNKKAQQEHPGAPGVVIGMNDERGGVSFIHLLNV